MSDVDWRTVFAPCPVCGRQKQVVDGRVVLHDVEPGVRCAGGGREWRPVAEVPL